MKIEAIINEGSGTVNGAAGAEHEQPSLQQRLIDLFAAHNVDVNVSVASTGAEVIELAKRAARGDADVIVAGGGDGTINSVAAAALGVQKTLGILPLGTLNHLAKDLGIPLDLEGAVRTIVDGHIVPIDVGEVNGRVFLNNSSLGLYPSIVHEREKQQRLGWGKWPAFAWAALSVMRRYPFLSVRLNVDGSDFITRTPFVFVGNNEYEMETLNIGSRARLDRGRLSLYVTNRIGRLGLIRLAFRALFGGLRQEKDFIALTTGELWIETKHKRVRVALDGEVTLMHPALHYQVRPGALRVIAPNTNRP